MTHTTTKFFKGSCPVYNEGRTITVHSVGYGKQSVSMTCEHDGECTLKTCPIKSAILSIFD